ncbi:unnamed protein product [Adineta ricciae]|uniref:Uncharacterized protein n=1 Tax=Adineta ricciae TaxID=249248 RepID=A0A815KKH5_ADIRI|nr:unnamed protein product [Adineta ricciae]CAF1494535.1 unnamed protein product [Adineta ricciae]
MDGNLDFCLKRFADDQLSDSLKKLTQIERNLERKRTYDAETSQHDNDLKHQQETLLAKQFSQDLDENNSKINKTRQIIEEEFFHALQLIRNDVETIVQVSSTRNENREDSEEIRAAITKIRQQIAQIDSELTHLFNIIDSNNYHDHRNRIVQWLRQHYGYANELNRMVGKFNELGDLSVFSAQTFLMQTINECVSLWNARYKLISQFIHQMDEDSILSKQILDSLYRMTDSTTSLQFVQSYVENRCVRRFNREEYLIRRIEEEFEEQLAEQQRRIFELINALGQLCVNTTNEFQLNKKFRKIFHQNRVLPILMDRNNEAENNSLIIRLEDNYTRWTLNKHSIQQQFCLNLSQFLNLPDETFTIERVEQGSTILYIAIHPTYHQMISQQLNNSRESLRIVQAVENSTQRLDCQVQSISFGQYCLSIEKRLINYKSDAPFINKSVENILLDLIALSDNDSLCPEGWKRFSIQSVHSNSQVETKWPIVYHGCRGFYAPFILTTAMRVSTQRSNISRNRQNIHFSPSIEYCAHPKYTHMWRNMANQYYQLVFQCRVNPDVFNKPTSEILLQPSAKTKQIDENFSNDQLEWILPLNQASQECIQENIICCAIMIRMIDGEPQDLPKLHWWQNTNHSE